MTGEPSWKDKQSWAEAWAAWREEVTAQLLKTGEYTFKVDDLRLSTLHLSPDGKITAEYHDR